MGRTSRRLGSHARKFQAAQIQFIDERVDDRRRVLVANLVFKIFAEQRAVACALRSG
jgi:hypothetical protein